MFVNGKICNIKMEYFEKKFHDNYGKGINLLDFSELSGDNITTMSSEVLANYNKIQRRV